MRVHSIFPTAVFETELDWQDKKPDYMNALMKHFTDGWTNETTGDVNVHLDPELASLYDQVIQKFRSFLVNLALEPDEYNIVITKSWINAIQDQTIPSHQHADAHFSFSLYLNTPERYRQNIQFDVDYKHPSEPCFGFFAQNAKGWNNQNALSMQYPVEEGKLFIFPGTLRHETKFVGDQPEWGIDPTVRSVEDLYNHRVGIAGDIILVYKEKQPSAVGIQPFDNWRVY